jgi:hypothetical protein
MEVVKARSLARRPHALCREPDERLGCIPTGAQVLRTHRHPTPRVLRNAEGLEGDGYVRYAALRQTQPMPQTPFDRFALRQGHHLVAATLPRSCHLGEPSDASGRDALPLRSLEATRDPSRRRLPEACVIEFVCGREPLSNRSPGKETIATRTLGRVEEGEVALTRDRTRALFLARLTASRSLPAAGPPSPRGTDRRSTATPSARPRRRGTSSGSRSPRWCAPRPAAARPRIAPSPRARR